MDDAIRKAALRAGVKLVGGLLIVGGFVAVRMVTADHTGIEAEIDELAAVEQALAADAAARGVEPVEASDDAESGLVARMGDRVRSALPGPSTSAEDERLVACRLAGGVQFMRAADCLTRGGDSSDIDLERR